MRPVEQELARREADLTPTASLGRELYRTGRELFRRHVGHALRGDLVDGLTYVMTYRCNSRCVSCDIWKDPGPVASELSLPELALFVESSRLLAQLRYVNLTGGEPFLREDIAGIARFFLARYPALELAIPTNGLLVPKTLRKLEEILEGHDPARVAMGVSLDGIGSTHDRIRGIPGNFEKCVELVRALTARWPTLRVGVGMTLCPENLEELPRVFELAVDLGVGFTTRFAQTSFYYHNDRPEQAASSAWTPELKVRAHQALGSLRDRRFAGAGVFARALDPAYAFLTEAVERTFSPERSHTCYSGTHSFFLDPFGNVYPCIMLSQRMGNVREASFDTLWAGQPARAVRDTIARRRCNCWTECETLPSLARSVRYSLSQTAAALKSEVAARRR